MTKIDFFGTNGLLGRSKVLENFLNSTKVKKNRKKKCPKENFTYFFKEKYRGKLLNIF